MAQTLRRSKKTKRTVEQGVICVSALYNNTHVSISDTDGNVLTWHSGGRAGFKGAREATPYAASMAMEKCLEEAIRLYGLKRVHVSVKGVGSGRDNALRAIVAAGIEIDSIVDETPVPYNGTKKKKIRKL
jgi:small subunit ribosomal protein S11